ncbi:MAG: InlB B-repeat-containing protein [Clostridia bacterium]|nr:InlB B-repeat-containing protein [Clostridia bacterium]
MKLKNKILCLLLCVLCLCGIVALASCEPSGPKYTVTFNPGNGGTMVSESTIQVVEGQKIPTPTATKEGYRVNGWYSGRTANTKWDFENDVVTEDVTLTAWWTPDYPQGGGCDHNYVENANRVNTYPTCEKSGKINYVCTECTGETYEVKPRLGHDLGEEIVAPTCGDKGYTRVYCKREGCTYEERKNEVNATGDHQWSKWEVVTPATKYTSGLEKKTCSVCNGTYEVIISATYTDEPDCFDSLEIGNYKYTGGDYVNAPFVNITKFAGSYASNYYTICEPKLAIDGDVSTYWSADTLADGAQMTGGFYQVSFAQEFVVGAISAIVPFYTSWEVAEDCYVSYDIMALVGSEWQKVGELSDKNASQSGLNGYVLTELESPVTTKEIKLVVSHSSRYCPAAIYELEVLAEAPKNERVPVSLVGSSLVTASGVYNSWGNAPSDAIDGSNSSYWFTDTKHASDGHEVYICLDFSEDKYLAAVQFTVTANYGSKNYTLYYWDKTLNGGEGDWATRDDLDFLAGTDTCTAGGVYSEAEKSGRICTFLAEMDVTTSKIKLVEYNVDGTAKSMADYKVCEILPLTIIEQAKADAIGTYTGCLHNYRIVDRNGDGKRNDKDAIPATCTSIGYTNMECSKCKMTIKTDATDILKHTWGVPTIKTAATATSLGVKESVCGGCSATKTFNYQETLEQPVVTPYYHNAPSAWAMTFDDGNYIGTYEWVIPKLLEYNYKATAVLSVCYVTGYVKEWQGYFASGAFDLGSHSYNHTYIYTAAASEKNLLDEVNKANYWFMNNFKGQMVLTFATPGGTTSQPNAEYFAGVMAAGRHGDAQVFDNIMDNLTERKHWGDLNTYVSKSDQTEGFYVFVKDGKILSDVKYAGAINTSGSFGKIQTGVNSKGNAIYSSEWSEWIEGANVLSNGGFEILLEEGVTADNGENRVYDNNYIVIKTLTGVKICAKETLDALTVQNYIFNPETNMMELSEQVGTYYYDEANYKFEWKTTGSYVDQGGVLVYNESDDSGYKLYHVTLGSYEKYINYLVENGSWTIECIHEINGPTISVTYAATISKFEHLKKAGVWCGSWYQVTLYGKEYQSSNIEVLESTDSQIKLNLTDEMDDFLFNQALTIKVDIPDSWTSVTATQAGKEIPLVTNAEYKDDMTVVTCTIINELIDEEAGTYNKYLCIDAIPDGGEIVITGITE